MHDSTGIEIDRRSLTLDEPLKELGEVEVPVRLHAEVVVPIVVDVVARVAPRRVAARAGPADKPIAGSSLARG